MIKDEKSLTAYLSKVKMTDVIKLKKREDRNKEIILKSIE